MSEVKRYSRDFQGNMQQDPDGAWVLAADAVMRDTRVLAQVDRVTIERDAALAENKLLRHDVSSYLETVTKVCDMLGVDLESAKSAEGKPSDVLFSYVSSMQQRLTAADERVDSMVNLLEIWRTWLGPTRESCDETGKRIWDRIDAATGFKPAEGGGYD